MASADAMRLLVLDAEDEVPALLKSLLRGRLERPFIIEARTDLPSRTEQQSYDVLILECDGATNTGASITWPRCSGCRRICSSSLRTIPEK